MAAYRRVYDSRHLQALPRTGISSGTLRSVIEYGLTFVTFLIANFMRQHLTLVGQFFFR